MRQKINQLALHYTIWVWFKISDTLERIGL